MTFYRGYKIYNFEDECWIASRLTYKDTLRWYAETSGDNIEDIRCWSIRVCDFLNEKIHDEERVGDKEYITLKEAFDTTKDKDDIFFIAFG